MRRNHAPFRGGIVIRSLGLTMINLPTEFEVSAFTH